VKRPRTFRACGGRRGRIVWGMPHPRERAWALCWPDHHTIQLPIAVDDETLCKCVCEELIHDHAPILSEECVGAMSDAISDLLARLGYDRDGDE